MYLLFLDESGTHGSAPVFVLGGLAVHEFDVPHLQKRIEGQLTYRLADLGQDARNFEIHAKELKSGSGNWAAIPINTRLKILGALYRSLVTYKPVTAVFPCALFAAVVDGSYHDRDERAYDLVLNKFDEMLDRLYHQHGQRHTGLVVHDRRVVDTPLRSRAGTQAAAQNMERRIQEWTADWQEVASKVGILHNLSHVPLFADSKATRLVQLADLVCWALWRHYSKDPP